MSDLQASIDHFAALEWTHSTLHDPQFQKIPEPRNVSHGGVGHTLMGKTWNTDGTIKERLTLFRRGTFASSSSDDDDSSSSFPLPEATRPESRRFYTFGADLNAHPHLVHGGVIACVLDSCMGSAIGFTLARRQGGGPPPTFTVQLNIRYQKPIRTPGSVIVRSWVTKVEDGGRKAWAEGVIESPEGVHARAEGLWVRPKARI